MRGEEESSRILTELASHEPATAVQLALSEAALRRRQIFLRAALRGWAERDPAAATQWVIDHVRAPERRQLAAALIEGAIVQPAKAIELVQRLSAADPNSAGEYGATLVAQLARQGEFDLAVRVAGGGNSNDRAHWVSTAFFEWALRHPLAALTGIAQLDDPAGREQAWQSAISGWATGDPASLVEHAHQQLLGEPRTQALREGLLQWVSADPVAAMKWMERLEPGEAFDTAAAAVATLVDLVQRNPDVALSWARSIKDPARRSSTVAEIVRQWSMQDPAGARRHAELTPDLTEEERRAVLADFESACPPSG